MMNIQRQHDLLLKQLEPGRIHHLKSQTICPTDGVTSVANIPHEIRLLQNYPNPFNPSTVIPFSITEYGVTKLSIYNMLGQRVCTILNQGLAPGSYEVVWNGNNEYGLPVSSGAYIYHLNNNQNQASEMMIFLDGGNRTQSSSPSISTLLNSGSAYNSMSKERDSTQELDEVYLVTIDDIGEPYIHFEDDYVTITEDGIYDFEVINVLLDQNRRGPRI